MEVGLYAGVFLNEARSRGWKVRGIEPLELPALYSEEHFGIPGIREYLEDADIEPGTVDVAVANRDDSMTFRLLGSRERSVRCDGHIFSGRLGLQKFVLNLNMRDMQRAYCVRP